MAHRLTSLHRPRNVDEIKQIAMSSVKQHWNASRTLLHWVIAAWNYQNDGRSLLKERHLERALICFVMAEHLMRNMRLRPNYNTVLGVTERHRLSQVCCCTCCVRDYEL